MGRLLVGEAGQLWMGRSGALIVSPYDDGIIWEADFTTLPVGAAASLPGGLLFARALNAASTSETVQTSASTVVTAGLTANVARIGQRNDDPLQRGLVFEHSAQNMVPNARVLSGTPTGWGTGHFGSSTPTANHIAGPDGDVLADRVQVTSASSGLVFNAVSSGWLSLWVRHTSSSGTYSGGIKNNANLEQTVNTTWRKLSQISSADQTDCYVIERAYAGAALTPTSADTGRDCCIDLVQIGGGTPTALGRIITECILGNGTANTERKGERLYLADIATLINGGGINLEYDFTPKGAATAYGEALRFWHKDANNYAEISHSTRRLNVVIGGSSWNPATALSWSADDRVELEVAAGGGSLNSWAKYRVNGGATIDLGNSGSPQGTISGGAAVNLLGDSDGASTHTKQATCWSHKLRARKRDRSAAWAA